MSIFFRLRLHQEVRDFFDWMAPKEEEHMMRLHVVNKISTVITELWPNAMVVQNSHYLSTYYIFLCCNVLICL